MEHLILSIKNSRKLPFLKELLKHMELVEIIDTKSFAREINKQQFLQELESAVEDVNAIKLGKKKGKPFQQLLDEL